jgi:hypothetical protein
MPSAPSLQACAKMAAPSPSRLLAVLDAGGRLGEDLREPRVALL